VPQRFGFCVEGLSLSLAFFVYPVCVELSVLLLHGVTVPTPLLSGPLFLRVPGLPIFALECFAMYVGGAYLFSAKYVAEKKYSK
jgi:hypothetical protein